MGNAYFPLAGLVRARLVLIFFYSYLTNARGRIGATTRVPCSVLCKMYKLGEANRNDAPSSVLFTLCTVIPLNKKPGLLRTAPDVIKPDRRPSRE